MGFLDKVKSTAQQVGGKAQEGLKAGQEKLDDVRAKKRIEGLKEELGGIVYLQRTGRPPEDAEAEIGRLVGQIQTAEAELAEDTAAPGADAAGS